MFAQQAVKDCCDTKKARFDEQYPHLAKIDNDFFHDSETFFDDFTRSLDRPPLSMLSLNPLATGHDVTLGKKWFEKSLESIQESTQLLGTMEFDVNEARQLQTEIGNQIATLERKLNEQTNVIENGFRGVCDKFAKHAMKHALTKALDGCEHDLTSFEPDSKIQDRHDDDLLVDQPIGDQRNDPNEPLKGILKKEGIDEDDKPKRRVRFTEQSLRFEIPSNDVEGEKVEPKRVQTREDGGLPPVKVGKTRTQGGEVRLTRFLA
jgi:hypothetical protein